MDQDLEQYLHSSYVLPMTLFVVSRLLFLVFSCILITIGVTLGFLRARKKNIYV